MTIEQQRFLTALQKQQILDKDITDLPFLRNVPCEYARWIDDSELCMELKSFLKAIALSEEYPMGASTLQTWQDIIKQNEEFPVLKKYGFFIIASAGNGDPVVIEWKTLKGATGYLSHDELWVWDQEPPDPHGYFNRLADSIGEFAEKAVPIYGFPLDYFGTMPEQDG